LTEDLSIQFQQFPELEKWQLKVRWRFHNGTE
jgi:hypothetical protein